MKQTQRGRRPAAFQHAGTGHTCGECERGRLNEKCLNSNGEPFMIYCEYGQRGYSVTAGNHVTYTDLAACENFVQGKRKEEL